MPGGRPRAGILGLVNVRSLSPQGGGKLLPFRGPPADVRDPAGAEAGVGDPAASGGPPPRVVDLSGRRTTEPAGGGVPGRPPWARRAVVVSCVVAVVGGATAAALSGALPLSSDSPQRRAAVVAPPTTAGGVEGDVPAAYGLCTAFDRAAERGDDAATAVAFRNLARAAGGAVRVSSYCAPFDGLSRGRAR